MVAGLLGRANSMRMKRLTQQPQLPGADALDVRPEGTAQIEPRMPDRPEVLPPRAPRATRWPWIALAFAAGAGIATALALAFAS